MTSLHTPKTYRSLLGTGRLLTLEDDGGRCRATGDDEVMQAPGGPQGPQSVEVSTCHRLFERETMGKPRGKTHGKPIFVTSLKKISTADKEILVLICDKLLQKKTTLFA